MSLTDGTSKMSKSAPSDASRINLLDPPDVITAKVCDRLHACLLDEHDSSLRLIDELGTPRSGPFF